jgi:cytochrome c oxidase assembly factor CtaG
VGERLVARIGLAVALVVVPPVLASGLLGQDLYLDINRDYPGPATALIGAGLRGATDLAGVITLGSLVTVLFLHHRTARTAGRLTDGPDLRTLFWSSLVWCCLSTVSIVVSSADTNGLALSRLAEPGSLGVVYFFGYMPRAWTVTAIAALVCVVCSYLATRWTTLLPGLWAGCLGILAPVVVGQILVGPNHDIGGDAGTLQTLAVGLLLGPLLVDRGLFSPDGKGPVDTIRRRLRRCVRMGVPTSLVTEIVLTWFKLAGQSPLESVTGVLALVRIAILVAVAFLVMGRRARPRPGFVAFLVLAWLGIGAAMTRIPPPHYFVPTSISQVFMGYEVPRPPTAATLMGDWRLNLLFVELAVVGVVLYMVMVVGLYRRHDAWPHGRTAAWIAGWVILVILTNSGLGRYSAPDFAVHMVLHMGLTMLVPILLVQGGVVTLVLRFARVRREEAGLHAWVTQLLHWRGLRVLYNPLLVFVVFVGSYYLLYFIPLFGLMMRYHWAHQLMNLHFLIIGYLYYSLIIGVDRPPRPLPHIARLGYTLAAMPFHAFFGVAIISSSTLLAETYYRYLDLPWADLWHAQGAGGSVAWAGGEVPLVFAMIVLGVQWARQDEVEARRRDRHIDRGLDQEFDAYNDMLKKLNERKDH